MKSENKMTMLTVKRRQRRRDEKLKETAKEDRGVTGRRYSKNPRIRT